MTKKTKTNSGPSVTRYVLTGAALGIYFGWFFRPSDQGFTIITILMLTILITLVFTGIFAYRERPAFSTLTIKFGVNFIKALLVVLVLAARHLFYDLGGRTAVIIFTIIVGIIGGLWYAYEQKIWFAGQQKN